MQIVSINLLPTTALYALMFTGIALALIAQPVQLRLRRAAAADTAPRALRIAGHRFGSAALLLVGGSLLMAVEIVILASLTGGSFN